MTVRVGLGREEFLSVLIKSFLRIAIFVLYSITTKLISACWAMMGMMKCVQMGALYDSASVSRLRPHWYFRSLFYHDEAHFCLLSNDGDEELRASWHPVVFGLKIEVSSEKMVLFYGIRVPGIHRYSSLNNR